MNLPLAYVVGLALIAKPFYFFSSGLPQPSDLLLLFAAFLVIWVVRPLPCPDRTVVIALAAFFVWVAVVNTAWATIYGSLDIFRYSIFYAFNFFAFLAMLGVCQDRRALKVIMACLAIGLATQIVLFLLTGGASGREYGGADAARQIIFFNNPNQLGLWALASACMFGLIAERIGCSKLLMLIVMGCALIATILSLSRAAMIAIVALFVAMNLQRPFLIAIVGAGGMLLVASVDLQLIGFVLERLESIINNPDRDYSRLQDLAQYMFLGAGEGALDRFHSEHQQEIHSIYGTLFFSYGILGALLFSFLLWRVFRLAPMCFLVFVGPILIHGLVHNDLRLSFFWMLLALVISKPQADFRTAALSQHRT